jgi:hypothetical protein
VGEDEAGAAMRVAIIGSRAYPRLGDVAEHVNALPVDTIVITGAWFVGSSSPSPFYRATHGVDQAAAEAADRRGLALVLCPTCSKHDPRRAGPIRNITVEAIADRVVAFWDGKSTGTMHTVGLFERAGKPTHVIQPMRCPNPYHPPECTGNLNVCKAVDEG